MSFGTFLVLAMLVLKMFACILCALSQLRSWLAQKSFGSSFAISEAIVNSCRFFPCINRFELHMSISAYAAIDPKTLKANPFKTSARCATGKSLKALNEFISDGSFGSSVVLI